MISWRCPSDDAIRRFLEAQAEAALSYAPVGMTAGPAVKGYRLDRQQTRLGRGAKAFEAGREAIRRWRMFDQGWLTLCWPGAEIRVGTDVAVLAHQAGLWWLNACRIVYVVDEPGRFGFAYGTLPAHAEHGEEWFGVQRDAGGEVWYTLRVQWRPSGWLVRATYPLMWLTQQRFARVSLRAMWRAVSERQREGGDDEGRNG